MPNSGRTVVLTVLLACSLRFSSAHAQHTPQQDLDQARDLLRSGQRDQAVLLMKTAAKRAREQGDKQTAAEAGMDAAEALLRLGQKQEALLAIEQAETDAKGTELESVLSVSSALQIADISKDDGAFLDSLVWLFAAQDELPHVRSEERRRSLYSRELTQRVDLYIGFLRVKLDTLKKAKAHELPSADVIFLAAAIENRPPKDFDPVSKDLLDYMDAIAPYDEPLLAEARRRNLEVTEIDQKVAAKLSDNAAAEDAVAQDKSQLAVIEQLAGDLDQAAALRLEALATFKKFHSSSDMVVALDGLAHIRLQQLRQARDAKQGLEALTDALDKSNELVFYVEKQTYGLTGLSLEPYLNQYSSAYRRYLHLCLDMYHMPVPTELHQLALEQLVLQADRMNFRAVRRDFGVYRELGDQIRADPKVMTQLEEQRAALVGAYRKAWQEGKPPSAFRVEAQGFSADISSPYTALAKAKKEFASVFEDFKRQSVGTGGTSVQMPRTLAEVRQGMSDSDGIVMYFQKPMRPQDTYYLAMPPDAASQKSEELEAVVITAEQTRLVELNLALPRLKQLVKDLTSNVDSSSSQANLAGVLLNRLGVLPKNLTVILTPDLIGVPFEVLTAEDGQPLIAQHTIRYAFGLAPQIGSVEPVQSYRSAFIAGAESFSQPGLEPIPESAQEVSSLRDFFRQNGLGVSPDDALPKKGRPLFSQGQNVDILHLSTHSVPDDQLPLLDSLAFPTDEVFGYDLGLTPVRARLVVLSACELFVRKTNSAPDLPVSGATAAQIQALYPVSGITTASLARIAPVVVSTLWEIPASTATRIFLRRFYSALLDNGQPSTALAIAKRDFLHPSQLKEWMMLNHVPVPPDDEMRMFQRPYNWAGFALVVGIPR